MIKTIYLVRHVHFQVPHPRPEAYITRKASLSVTGLEDIVTLGHEIKALEKYISKIYTSPYLRAIETAELLAKTFIGCPIELDENVTEDKLVLPNEVHLEECYLKFKDCTDKALDNDGPSIIVSHEFPISVFVSKSSGITFEQMVKSKKHLELLKMGECIVAKFSNRKLVSHNIFK